MTAPDAILLALTILALLQAWENTALKRELERAERRLRIG